MRLRSFVGRRFRFPISRSTAALAALLVALAWSSPSFCGPIHDAASHGDLAKVKALLQHSSALVFSKDDHGWTPLHYAAERGHKHVAELLIASGAEVNVRNGVDATPLCMAAENGQKGVAEMLLANHAEVNAKENVWTPFADNSKTALHAAAEGGHKDVVELLLANGADVNAKNNDGQTPLGAVLSMIGKHPCQATMTWRHCCASLAAMSETYRNRATPLAAKQAERP